MNRILDNWTNFGNKRCRIGVGNQLPNITRLARAPLVIELTENRFCQMVGLVNGTDHFNFKEIHPISWPTTDHANPANEPTCGYTGIKCPQPGRSILYINDCFCSLEWCFADSFSCTFRSVFGFDFAVHHCPGFDSPDFGAAKVLSARQGTKEIGRSMDRKVILVINL